MERVGSPKTVLDDLWSKIDAHADLDGYSVIKSLPGPYKANRSRPPPSELVGTIDQLRECLACLPNRRENNRDRDQWVAIVHAIVAATGKSEEGKAAALDWSAEWDAGEKAMRDAEAL
jgi:hypothetical protein